MLSRRSPLARSCGVARAHGACLCALANPPARRIYLSTAIFITTDEGGGYYDLGYIQPVDFFDDGTRIPFIVVSPHAKKGFVDHHSS